MTEKNKRILLVTEANSQVASGHLLECVELGRLLRASECIVDTVVNDDVQKEFKQRIIGELYEYHKSVELDFEFFSDILKRRHYDIIVTDLRKVSDNWIRHIGQYCNAAIVCIDELGHRSLSSDVVINPMIDPYFWDYKDSKARIYAGHEYLILSDELVGYNSRDKAISSEIRRVCISMGGVDKFGTTIKIVKWLIKNSPDVYADIILGGGFPYKEELLSLISNNDQMHMMQNVTNIYEYFDKADIAFCAGGNTLHELACIGVPVIIIPTMEHEVNNGKRFEQMGFGFTLSRTEEISDPEISDAWTRMKDIETRREMMQAGKRICRGDGGRKTVDIIMSLD